MKYLKRYNNISENLDSKTNEQLKEILSNPGWERKEPSEEHWDIELTYKLSDNVYIDVIKFKEERFNVTGHFNYYLRDVRDDSFHYVNQYEDNYTELFKFYPRYQRMMKICEHLLPYFQKKPSKELIDDIRECFSEILDMSFSEVNGRVIYRY